MAPTPNDQTATAAATAEEASKVLDALSALAVDLSCHCDVAPDTLILSARKTREACDAIEEAVKALKTILRIAEAAGGGRVQAAARARPDDADN